MLDILFKSPQKLASQTANTQDIFKTLAIILMIIDHLGVYFYPDNSNLRLLGRLCVPVWFFYAGYNLNASSYKSSTNNLLVLGIVLELITIILGKPIFAFNILISMALVRYILVCFNKPKHIEQNYLVFFVGLFICYFLIFPFIEYATIGLAMAYMGYALKQQNHNAKFNFKLLIYCTLFFTASQAATFGFTLLQTLILALGSYAVFYALTKYQNNMVYNSLNIKLISRNSLLIYFIHIPIFIYLSTNYNSIFNNGTISIF